MKKKDWFDVVFKDVLTNDGMKSLLFEESVTLAILSIYIKRGNRTISKCNRKFLRVCVCVSLEEVYFSWKIFIFGGICGLLMTPSLNFCFSSTLMSHDKMKFIRMPGLVKTEQPFQHTLWKNKTIAVPIDVVNMGVRGASPCMV